MAESKFSGLGAAIKQARKQPTGQQRTVDTPKPRAKARPVGKRSDPAWRQHTVMLKHETHVEATDMLRRRDEGQDVSDLLQSLLEQWVSRYRKT